jgi:DNA-binding Lrp family transcriptional regulator
MASLNVDNMDLKLISELEFNPRISISELAKKLKVGKELVKYRIAKLAKQKLIQHYSCIINASKLGYLYYRIYLKLRNISEQEYEEIVNYFINNPKVAYLADLQGEYDLQLGFWAKDPKDFEIYQTEFLSKLSKYILERDVSLGSKLTMLPIRLINPTNSSEVVMNSIEKAEDVDDLDLKILMELTKNSRQSYEEMSRKIDLTGKAIKYRVKQLEKKGILLGYVTYIDFTMLGYYNVKLFLKLKNSDIKSEELLNKNMKKILNLVRINKPIGNYDLELEVLVKDILDLHKLNKKLSFDNNNIIDSQSFVFVIYEYIRRWIPLD